MEENNVELALVMPVYNEQEIIQRTVTEWIALLEQLNINYEFHIYDDGSEDRTPQILKELASANPKIIPHFNPKTGYGPALIRGCRDNAAAKWIFLTDSSNDADPKSFGRMWGMRRSYYFIVGKRKRKLSVKHFTLSLFSSILIKILYGRGLSDVNSPCRLMLCDVFRETFQKLPDDTIAPNVIISGEACRRQIAMHELKIDSYHAKSGSGHYLKDLSMKTVWKVLHETIRFRIKNF
jgi:glycosyltransferase involved in cell wall biosynthesis